VVLDIVFWILAIIAIAAALGVVLLGNVFRAAISLVFLFLIVAGIYITLHADFLAFVQILVYVGAIGILVIVGIMLTHDITHGNPTGKFRIPALIVSVLLFCTLAFTIVNTPWVISDLPPHEPTTAFLGEKLFGTGGFVLPVEIIAVLLLTAILGAIVLMREK
jgi:NADH-quinone oxidoreductase subunit J